MFAWGVSDLNSSVYRCGQVCSFQYTVSLKGFNMQQNISLLLGNRGHTLSIMQDFYNTASQKHHVEVALFNGEGEMVESGLWYHGVTYDEMDDKYYDTVVPFVNGAELEFVIAKAKAWVNKNQ